MKKIKALLMRIKDFWTLIKPHGRNDYVGLIVYLLATLFLNIQTAVLLLAVKETDDRRYKKDGGYEWPDVVRNLIVILATYWICQTLK